MAFFVDNKPVSRRQLYATMIGVLAFVEFAVRGVDQSDVFRTRLEMFIVIAIVWSLIELIRSR